MSSNGGTVNFEHGEFCYEFAKWAQDITENSVYLWGFGFDGTACFRKGARLGPISLRKVSYGIESYSPYLDSDLEDYSNVFDLGDVPFSDTGNCEKDFLKSSEAIENTLMSQKLNESKNRFLLIGGEHSVSYAQIKSYLKQFPDMVLLHLDAHADLRDGYEGHHYSHASIMRRCLDHFEDGHHLIQYGIRSGTKEEYEWMKEHGTLKTIRSSFLESVESIPSDRPIYLTLDLDYFDPGIFPGTGTPEPGGEDFNSFISLMKILQNKKLVGADVVELSPELDSSGNSSVFASKVVRELLLVLAGEVEGDVNND
ncbi:MAG: agmatinase [Bacteriovoracaceae bacterium]|nr:agmatinase [Bacteriovoracaceae bacterium]